MTEKEPDPPLQRRNDIVLSPSSWLISRSHTLTTTT